MPQSDHDTVPDRVREMIVRHFEGMRKGVEEATGREIGAIYGPPPIVSLLDTLFAGPLRGHLMGVVLGPYVKMAAVESVHCELDFGAMGEPLPVQDQLALANLLKTIIITDEVLIAKDPVEERKARMRQRGPQKRGEWWNKRR